MLNWFLVPDESSAGKALFPITSFASHDCLNNAFRTRIWKKNESEDPFIQTRAKIAIHGKIIVKRN